MKKSYGFGVLIAVILTAAAARLGQAGDTTSAPADAVRLPESRAAKLRPSAMPGRVTHDGATGVADTCISFLQAPKDEEQRRIQDPTGLNFGAARRVISSFFGDEEVSPDGLPLAPTVQYAVVFAPDPIRTNLALFFDREIVAVQQAAQDSGYDYDSEWLPWKRRSPEPLALLEDRESAQLAERQREACPGVLLFRKHVSVEPKPDTATQAGRNAFDQGLVVFVVGEEPTGGMNLRQWQFAVTQLKLAQTRTGAERLLRILGPTFSGSFPLLEREIAGIRDQFAQIRILSGMTSEAQAQSWFRDRLRNMGTPPLPGAQEAVFGSFNEDDGVQIQRFLSYLSRRYSKHCPSVAILSEDETQYGRGHFEPLKNSCSASGRETIQQITYPRDISSLREAYESQSLFEPMAKEHIFRTILKNQADPAMGEDLDTLPSYGGDVSAIDQEARLFGLLDHLKSHHVDYLIIRATNPLDLLFLSRFFRRAYPEAHIVTVGSDLLFRREVDTTDFRGSMALTVYPLLARYAHWTQPDRRDLAFEQKMRHWVFSGDVGGGSYMAARFLFDGEKANAPAGTNPESPLVFNYPKDTTKPLPPYAAPLWPSTTGAGLHQSPDTWLMVVGRDGYWPIAALDDGASQTLPKTGVCNPPCSAMVQVTAPPGKTSPGEQMPGYMYHTPLSENIFYWLATLLVLYQVVGLNKLGPSTSDSLSLIFHNNPRSEWQAVLRGINSAIALLPLAALTLPRLLLLGSWHLYRSAYVSGRDQLFEDFRALPLIIFFLLIFFNLRKPNDIWKLLREERKIRFWYSFRDEKKRARRIASRWYCAASILFTIPVWGLWWLIRTHTFELYPSIYRFEHLTSGVSPLLPLLILIVGFYLWTWQIMAGSLMLAPGRPELPIPQGIEAPTVPQGPVKSRFLRVLGRVISPLSQRPVDVMRRVEARLGFAREDSKSERRRFGLKRKFHRITDAMARQVYLFSHPLYFWRISYLSILLLCPIAFVYCFFDAIATSTIEGATFNFLLAGLLVLASVMTLVEACRMYVTWTQLRRVLLALARTRLRTAMKRLQPISAMSLWTVSSNVHRVQIRLLIQQQDALSRMVKLYCKSGSDCDECLARAQRGGDMFLAETRSNIGTGVAQFWWMGIDTEQKHEDGTESDPTIRELYRNAAAYLFNHTLRPRWKKYYSSLYERSKEPLAAEIKERWAFDSAEIEAAEEFVWAHYMSFVHVVVARMRTMAISMAVLFVAICFSVAFYPFVPRPYIQSLLVANLLVIGSVVAFVYAAMDRDEILSVMTNTVPGRLGAEFWTKYAGFLVGPLLGIFATQYPSVVETFLNWIQPGLGIVK